MIIRSGDCIPIRTDSSKWATFYGRVVGFNTVTAEVTVVNRDVKSQTFVVKHVIEDTRNFWLQTA